MDVGDSEEFCVLPFWAVAGLVDAAFWAGAGLADVAGGGTIFVTEDGVWLSGTGFIVATCSMAQLAARASIWVKLQPGSANVRIGSGFDLAAVAVERLTSASPRKRNTPPPPLHATAYAILRPRFCIRLMFCWLGRIIPVPGSRAEFEETS